MNLTVDSGCTFISTTTPDTNTLENWINGDLFNTQVSIFFDCNQVSTITLPNQYVLDSIVGNDCTPVIGGQEFTLTIGGITNAQINTTTTVSYTHLTLPTNREV